MQDRELEERLERALEEARLTRRSLLRRGVVFGAGLTALPAIATITRPVNAFEIPSASTAGSIA